MISNTDLSEAKTVENPDGIFRTTLSFGHESMLCHFKMTKGARIPLHNHVAVQNGYVISGKLKFHKGREGDTFIAKTGSSYFFASEEFHGCEVLEDTEAVECFSPMRPEYSPDAG